MYCLCVCYNVCVILCTIFVNKKCINKKTLDHMQWIRYVTTLRSFIFDVKRQDFTDHFTTDQIVVNSYTNV